MVNNMKLIVVFFREVEIGNFKEIFIWWYLMVINKDMKLLWMFVCNLWFLYFNGGCFVFFCLLMEMMSSVIDRICIIKIILF